MFTITTKPWMDREDGRIVVYKGNKVVMSKHYRDLEHREMIINDINKTINKGK